MILIVQGKSFEGLGQGCPRAPGSIEHILPLVPWEHVQDLLALLELFSLHEP